MHTDLVIYQFARNIIQSGLCNIILHAEIEYKRNNDLFYCVNVYKKRVMYHFVYIIKTPVVCKRAHVLLTLFVFACG
jgi:hypothetical protein